MTFKNGRKNNWRSWAWNRLIERASPTGVVLYLPGVENLDELVLLQKGLDKRDLIAIERDERIVDELRKRRVNVIHGEAFDVIEYWPKKTPPRMALFDFFGGISERNWMAFWMCFFNPAFEHSAMGFNVLRGRDTNWVDPINRQQIEETLSECLRIGIFPKWHNSKHRGIQFLLYWSKTLTAWFMRNGLPAEEAEKNTCTLINYFWFDKARVDFSSYQSGNLNYDSVVFKRDPSIFPTRVLHDEKHSIQSRISTALALRSQRLNGTLEFA